MKKNIVTIGIITIISILLFSPRTRQSIAQSESVNKAYELKNVLSDWRKNNSNVSY